MPRCPRCKLLTLQDNSVLNALSHDGKTQICNVCAQIESFEKTAPHLAEELKVGLRRIQAAVFGLDKNGNPKLPKD